MKHFQKGKDDLLPKLLLIFSALFLSSIIISYFLFKNILPGNPKAEINTSEEDSLPGSQSWNILPSPTQPYPPMLSPKPMPREMVFFPNAKYSQIIKKYNLEANINSGMLFEDRKRDAVDYLRRLRNLLVTERQGYVVDLPLTKYKIVDPYNIPLANPNNLEENGGDWRMADLIGAFLREYDRKPTNIYKEPFITIEYSPLYKKDSYDYDDDAPTASTFHNYIPPGITTINKWVRTSHFVISQQLFRVESWEEENTVYYGLTNVELANILIHEYVHVLQAQARLNMFVKGDFSDLNDDTGEFLLKLNDLSEKVNNKTMLMFEANQEAKVIIDEAISKRRGLKNYNIKEAQAHAVAYDFVYIICSLNGEAGGYFPGLRFFDPQKWDRYWSLYTSFWSWMIKKSSQYPDGVLSKEWLLFFPYD